MAGPQTEDRPRHLSNNSVPLIGLSEPAAWQDLATVFARAREAHPIGMADNGTPVVLRHDWVESLLKDPRFLQNDLSFLGHPPDGFVNRWYRQSLAALDPPDHTRIRALVTRAFTYRSMEELRPKISLIAQQSMLPAMETGRFDAVGPFSQILPVKAVMTILGIPDEELALFFDLAHDFGLLFSFAAPGNPAIEARLRKAMDGLDSYVTDLIARRRRQPSDDLLSELITVMEGEDRLTEQELVILVGTFLYAGVETTEAMLPIISYLLATRPAQFQNLKQHPELVPNAVDEALRFEPNVGVIARVAKEPVELAGVTIDTGQLVLGSVVSANRDPRRWSDPDSFLVDRDKPKTIGFGAGIHHCIGATLARIELQEATKLLLRARELEILNDPKWDAFSNSRQFDQVTIALTH